MPKFLDHHKMPGPPTQAEISQNVQAIKAGKSDPKTGVKGLNWFWTNNEAWCLVEAPNAQAVHTYHENMGLKLSGGDVSEIHAAV